MLNFFGQSHKNCDGISRRAFLRVGTLGLGGLTLADLLRARGEAVSGAKKSVIMVFLSGGPSHLDTYDMKPDLPAEYRGEFRPIQTKVAGLDICELMPRQAQIADRLAVLRGVRTVGNHTGNEFFSAYSYEEGNGGSKGIKRPPLGSVVSRLQSERPALPPYVSLIHPDQRWELPAHLGAAHRPFHAIPRDLSPGDPRPRQALANLSLAAGVSLDRLDDRRALMHSFDTLRRDLDATGNMAGLDAMNAQALDMVTSSKVRDAFDPAQVSDRLKERYGRTGAGRFGWKAGPLFLQARRLVEAGVRVVTLQIPGWDTHEKNFQDLRGLLPTVDQALHALITDLEERGMLEDVAIIMGGEMGRTPRIAQQRAGRDHWPQSGITIMAGGGLKVGQVVGASDAKAEQVKGRPITPAMMLTTLYHVLGIDPVTTLPDHNGRPIYLLDEREPIAELV